MGKSKGKERKRKEKNGKKRKEKKRKEKKRGGKEKLGGRHQHQPAPAAPAAPSTWRRAVQGHTVPARHAMAKRGKV